MKKALILSLFLLYAGLSLMAQQGKIKGFDFEKFHAQDKEAEWLCIYDRVAWVTSDSVVTEPDSITEQLGSMWFCVPGNGDVMWWAFYGRMDNGVFKEVLSYYVDTLGKVHKNDGLPFDKTLNQSIATAISNATDRLMQVRPENHTKIRHNSYVRVLEDKTIKVWLLPAFQTNGVAVYGGEYAGVFSADGSKRLQEEYVFLEEPLGFKTSPAGRTINVQYPEHTTPPFCAIFFARYYAPYFKTIYLECANSNSMLITENDGTYWVHAAKAPQKKGKK